MTIGEIAALPIGDLAHSDGCRLFLWLPMPNLHRTGESIPARHLHELFGRDKGADCEPGRPAR